MSLEKVGGRWQGACYPFRRGLKSGITRVLWGRDGSLWCGLTNRGWGSLGEAEHGLQRLRWCGVTPFELLEVTARADGFRLRFTLPVDAASVAASNFAVKSWTYDLHEEYGCPPRGTRETRVIAAEVGPDGLTVDLQLEDVAQARVYEVRCSGLRGRGSETALWHGVAWYTRNAAPAK